MVVEGLYYLCIENKGPDQLLYKQQMQLSDFNPSFVVSTFNGLMSTFCTPNLKDLASFCSCAGQYVSYMVKNL